MFLVPDASAIMGVALNDEEADYAQAVVDAIKIDGAVVPELFWFESRNALVVAERRKRISPAETAAFLADLELLPLEIDHHPREEMVFALARSHHLTIYDAAYLELAQRKNIPLATLDRALHRAAKAAGVTLFAK
jgi:predicted nucleic acid-binding protein